MPSSFELCDLTRAHDRTSFDSGCPPLDDFLHRYARQKHGRGESVTRIVADGTEVWGYVTWVASELKRPSKPPLPVLRLGRMAVDKRHQGKAIGANLVAEVLRTARDMRELVGCAGVVVDAKRCSRAAPYYERLGFKVMADEEGLPTVQMFMASKDLPAR